ncbi:MAG TPA: GNAT family N-acetyltransferase [Gammaproteobacteria bacterium]|jgi:RimJ/RimL family protein N-acetyltransferase/predicted acetyltransferase|nr:GNAT family N-acetyltransferase [Gammaproteobacteria bacterium]
MSNIGVILETKRLILKHPTASHFNELFQLRTDHQVMEYIGAIQTEEQVKEFIENAKSYSYKYHLGFYSVFEKETGQFVGQAGLFHLGFNIHQSDIELAYRLHTKYWNKGYATELAKALIHYGFQQLLLPKIIAILRPENERSRNVMEKAGMSYFGMMDYKDIKLPCYEIINPAIHFDQIELIQVSIDYYPVLQNMGRFYAYDMSEYLGKNAGWEMPEDGLYVCNDFERYWQDENSFPFLIRYQNEIVGFAIINKTGSHSEIDFNMAQFFILRKFKNKGIGKYVAEQCFKKFPGIWEVMVMPGNEGAYRFWRKIIKNYTHNHFVEYSCDVIHFKNPARRNIFKFNTMT